ncbi:hypothetical protein [Microvirga pakistanensis]|nr:hypothetical protein [Microvirga pakistanensis]
MEKHCQINWMVIGLDTQLAQQLGRLLEEVQRRLKKGRNKRPELEAAA